MNTLFPLEQNFPKGFTYDTDFITVEEENELINQIKNVELKNLNFQGYEAKRKVASFGFDWSFEKRLLTKGKPIPKEFEWLLTKVGLKFNIEISKISELLLTEYPNEAVINWHRDAPPFDTIIGISLLSNCTFRFRPHDKTKQNRKSITSFPVVRRSIYVMKDEARSEWEHSISPVEQTRYSITLRTLKT
jgi:alkylated DNA repair dioxygenase AlkB